MSDGGIKAREKCVCGGGGGILETTFKTATSTKPYGTCVRDELRQKHGNTAGKKNVTRA